MMVSFVEFIGTSDLYRFVFYTIVTSFSLILVLGGVSIIEAIHQSLSK